MALTPIFYGSINLNDGINYFVVRKNYGFPTIQPSIFKVARLEGMKKVGENINERKIDMDVRILGVSRADLEDKIDALQGALFERNQNLSMHTNDGRYFVCDCVDFVAEIKPGEIISTVAKLNFIAYTPFAYSASTSTYDTGIQLAATRPVSLGQKSYTFTFSVTAGGNVFTRPTLRLIQQTPACSMTMTGTTLNVGQIYSTVSCSATPQQLYAGDDLILSSGTHTQSVVVATDTAAGATSIPVGGFAANFAYAAGATVARDLAWNNVQVNQTTDNQVLVVTSNLPALHGDYIDMNSDPQSTNGFTAILNGGNTLSAIQGSFPVLEDGTTVWSITVNANSAPSLEAIWTWTNRWIS